MKRPQNTKAAAQRLAQVMSHQPGDNEDDEDDLYGFEPAIPSSVGIGLSAGRPRTRSPIHSVRNRTSVEQTTSTRPTPSSKVSTAVSSVDRKPSARPTSGAEAPTAMSSVDQKPALSTSLASFRRPPNLKPPIEPSPPPTRTSSVASQLSDLSTDLDEEAQSSSARSIKAGSRASSYLSLPDQQSPSAQSIKAGLRSSSYASLPDQQPSSARSIKAGLRSSSYVSLPDQQPPSAHFSSPVHRNLAPKTAAVVPPIAPVSTKAGVAGTGVERQFTKPKDKRLSLDFGTFKYKEPNDQQSFSALQDELDMLQEENDNLLAKLHMTEERCEESDARTRQLEKQIASQGGVSLESRVLSRKEAELQKREAALKVATQAYGGAAGEEILTLRMEAETARDEATSALELLRDVENEAKSFRAVTRTTILTREEMEEVVLKRCWLARCWSICLRCGIYAEIAGSRHEYWSSLVSNPVETILAAGKKAKDENSWNNMDLEQRKKDQNETNDVSKKGSVESMLLVEKGLRELNSLKVEEALAISMAQRRRPSVSKSNIIDELKLPLDSQYFSEAFELSAEESEDVLLKQAWLTYFWRRAKNHGLEPGVAEGKLQFWLDRRPKQVNSHDALDVERGLLELRKLAIEIKLWEKTRLTVYGS